MQGFNMDEAVADIEARNFRKSRTPQLDRRKGPAKVHSNKAAPGSVKLGDMFSKASWAYLRHATK